MPRPTTFRYIGSQDQFSDMTPIPTPGGRVVQFTAGATLNVGDSVYISAANTVNKSNTAANAEKVIGVVVGGASLPNYIFETGSPSVIPTALLQAPTVAATIGQLVYVQVTGVAYAIADGVVAVGDSVKGSVTNAGQVTSAVLGLTVAAGVTGVTSSAANGAIISGDYAGRVLGINIGAASAVAGDILTLLLS